MANKKRLYFAYGSNINIEQMKLRCPAARVVAPVTVPEYELAFNGKSSGWGVATIAPRKGCTVVGLLWEITPACEKALDIYEGFPKLYTKETVTAIDKSGKKYDAMVYIMASQYDQPACPSARYASTIINGFAENSLPPASLLRALRHNKTLTERSQRQMRRIG